MPFLFFKLGPLLRSLFNLIMTVFLLLPLSMQKDPEARLSINDMVVSDKALNNGLTDLCGGLQASLLLVFW